MTNFIHSINLFFDKIFKSTWVTKTHRLLLDEVYKLFKLRKEGLYIACIKSKNNTITAKAISLFSGPYSHCVLLYYSENIKEKVTQEEYQRLREKYKIYYGDILELDVILNSTKILVIGSADQNGMNYFDYSTYQSREQIIFKPELSPAQEKTILSYMLSKKSMDIIYDFMGLVFWCLKFVDDERAWFCSEQLCDIFSRQGVVLTTVKNPSPTQLVEYGKKNLPIIFSNVK